MTRIIDTKSNRRLPAKLAAGLAISALLGLFVVGTFAASAAEYRGGYRGGYYGRGGYNGCCWTGGYYVAPPVVYGSPYYYGYGAPYYAPPPVVYGPGIYLPGINVRIH